MTDSKVALQNEPLPTQAIALTPSVSTGPLTAVEDAIESQMLSAVELFHYESRFRHRLFVLAVEPEVPFENLLTDLKVLQASDIRILIFCQFSPELEESLNRWNLRGAKFRPLKHFLGDSISDENNLFLKKELSKNSIPVIALLPREGEASKSSRAEIAKAFALQALDTAQVLNALKVFFLSTFRGLEVNGKFLSHPSVEEIHEILANDSAINIGAEQLAFVQEQNSTRGVDIILLDGKSGSLFQEIFTHRGRGTLFTKEYPNLVRRGKLSDVTDISLLMRPYIGTHTILPVSEDEIAENIDDFFLYTINGAIVASARLADYGEASEIAKLCALPRFQGKGRAKILVQKMIEQAKKERKDYVFALSIEPRMWQFFLGLGFSDCPRESFPASWQVQYDLTRPSRGFRYNIR